MRRPKRQLTARHHWHGGAVPFAQTTFAPGGRTTVSPRLGGDDPLPLDELQAATDNRAPKRISHALFRPITCISQIRYAVKYARKRSPTATTPWKASRSTARQR
jgi:hypothetical protein